MSRKRTKGKRAPRPAPVAEWPELFTLTIAGETWRAVLVDGVLVTRGIPFGDEAPGDELDDDVSAHCDGDTRTIYVTNRQTDAEAARGIGRIILSVLRIHAGEVPHVA